MTIISKYASKMEEALEMLGAEACATERGWPLGPPRTAVTLRCGEGRARW